MKLPLPVVEQRKNTCRGCDCNVDFEDSCSSCPKRKWGQMLCTSLIDEHSVKLKTPPSFPREIETTNVLPSTITMAKSALKSFTNWTINGVKITDENTLKARLDQCHACEFWSASGFNNTGRCMKCGCSTWAKLRMNTERCPIGKW